MDSQPVSPEQEPLSEVEKLQYRLQELFLEYHPDTPGPWIMRRYVDGRRENIFDINRSPDAGVYVLGARIRSPLPDFFEDFVVGDTLTPEGRFLGGRGADASGTIYDERMARQFNGLLVRSTSKPYGVLGRMFLKAWWMRHRLVT